MGHRLALIAVLALSAAMVTAHARTTADGVYTEAQARQGQEVHRQHCANCHHQSYYQGPFLIAWQNQPVAALYDTIKLTMPQDRPGGLRPRDYAAFLAYLFELNGLPSGDERLGSSPEELQSILITRNP
jgi:S-disulfanyl-L-cysteine oxidoreductase SoxD